MKFKVWPKLHPNAKYVVWIVETSKTSTTNPMTKWAAMKMIVKRKKNKEYAKLIKAFSCIQSKNLMDGRL